MPKFRWKAGLGRPMYPRDSLSLIRKRKNSEENENTSVPTTTRPGSGGMSSICMINDNSLDFDSDSTIDTVRDASVSAVIHTDNPHVLHAGVLGCESDPEFGSDAFEKTDHFNIKNSTMNASSRGLQLGHNMEDISPIKKKPKRKGRKLLNVSVQSSNLLKPISLEQVGNSMVDEEIIEHTGNTPQHIRRFVKKLRARKVQQLGSAGSQAPEHFYEGKQHGDNRETQSISQAPRQSNLLKREQSCMLPKKHFFNPTSHDCETSLLTSSPATNFTERSRKHISSFEVSSIHVSSNSLSLQENFGPHPEHTVNSDEIVAYSVNLLSMNEMISKDVDNGMVGETNANHNENETEIPVNPIPSAHLSAVLTSGSRPASPRPSSPEIDEIMMPPSPEHLIYCYVQRKDSPRYPTGAEVPFDECFDKCFDG